jgi:inner membrane protein
MDPLTQGLVGATVTQTVTRTKAADGRRLVVAGCFGFIAGMAPDLDVLIRSSSDPLLFLEYHRQFTHAVPMIPVGGLLCAVLLHLLWGRQAGLPLLTGWLYCTIGYGTHGLLDAFTSYGTMLWWPFSTKRFALSYVPIVDPLFTLPLLVLVALATQRRRPRYTAAALVWSVAYIGAGMMQRNTAAEMGAALAASRGHTPVRLEAKPSFANILVWKIVYETGERFYVDAVRATIAPRVFPGASIHKLDAARDFAFLDPASRQARDVGRFAGFSDGFVARDPGDPHRIIDIRYSMVPNEIDALWSITVSPTAGPDAHVAFETHRRNAAMGLARLWSMLTAPATPRQ